MDAASLINTIAGTMREQGLITIERTLVRSLMLRMRPAGGYAEFAMVFRNRQHAERLYKHLQEYAQAYRDAPPEMQAELDEKVKVALNGVRKMEIGR